MDINNVNKINQIVKHPLIIPPNNSFVYCKLDSGASKSYIREQDKAVLTNIKSDTSNRQIILPNNEKISINHTGLLNTSKKLGVIGREASIVPGLRSASLLSVGALCDDNCTVHFDKQKVDIIKNNEVILHGKRNKEDGLYELPIKKVETEKLNVIIRLDKSKMELANFLHGAMFSPTVSTLRKAIRNKQLLTFPGINDIDFTKYVEDSVPTNMGHIRQERKFLRSTKCKISEETDVNMNDHDYNPVKEEKQYCLLSKLVPFTAKELAYGDMTGQFPYKSSRGNQYIYIMYDYDSNMILATAIPNRQAATIKKAWESMFLRLTKHGNKITHFILDNELSGELKKAFTKYSVQYQRVPPHIHRRNAAERAIQTFKSRLLSGLATCHSQFPVVEWDRLLMQAELTLNLLRTSRVNPRLSAWAYVEGPYDFNSWPIAPPGTKVIIQKKVEQRESFDYKGKEGWYIAPSMEHYRCVRCYVPSMHSEIIADTVEFITEKIPFPAVSTDFLIRQTARDLVHL